MDLKLILEVAAAKQNRTLKDMVKDAGWRWETFLIDTNGSRSVTPRAIARIYALLNRKTAWGADLDLDRIESDMDRTVEEARDLSAHRESCGVDMPTVSWDKLATALIDRREAWLNKKLASLVALRERVKLNRETAQILSPLVQSETSDEKFDLNQWLEEGNDTEGSQNPSDSKSTEEVSEAGP